MGCLIRHMVELFLGIRTRAIDVALPAMIFSMLYSVLQLQRKRKLKAIVAPLLVIIPFFWFPMLRMLVTV